jgi:hypothetical protein
MQAKPLRFSIGGKAENNNKIYFTPVLRALREKIQN